ALTVSVVHTCAVRSRMFVGLCSGTADASGFGYWSMSAWRLRPLGTAQGTYVTTVLGQELLERVTAHHLGNRSQAQVEVHKAGVAGMRAGEPNFLIPAESITAGSTISGMAGRFVEKDGILAVTSSLGESDVTHSSPNEPIDAHHQSCTQLDILTKRQQTA